MSYKCLSNCLKFSSVFIFLLFVQLATAQGKKKNDAAYNLDAFPTLDALLTKNQKVLGNDVIAMVWQDTLSYKRELGEFNSKTEMPLASSSKWLTTALILILQEEGKLSLDDKITSYLPIYSTYGKNYITIRHCLTHFTGIQTKDKVQEGKVESLEEEANSFARKEILSNPGTEFRWSNAGFMIAGRIAEIVTKKKFDQLIKSKLFNPLGMSKTSFSTMDGSGISPADGARSTAGDFIRFLAMLKNKGNFNGKQVLSEESINEMRKIHATTEIIRFAPKMATGMSHALGVFALDVQGEVAHALTAPGMFGTFPVVDWCHNYALLVVTKTLLSEQKPDLFLQMKGAVDDATQSNCR